ncbi:hypothetical protein D3C74_475270 [compost metagenome]
MLSSLTCSSPVLSWLTFARNAAASRAATTGPPDVANSGYAAVAATRPSYV